VLCLYSAITAPTFLIALIVVALLWLYGWRWRQNPVHVRGYALPEQVVAVALLLVTAFMLFFATDVVFWLLIVTLAVVFLHALLYTPEPEDEYGFGSEVGAATTSAQSATSLGFV